MAKVQRYRAQVPTEAARVPQRQGYRTIQMEPAIRRALPSAESFGAGFGEALAQLGDRIYAGELEKQDAAVHAAADRRLQDYGLNAIYGPKGVLSINGKDALALPDQVGESYDRLASQIRSGLNKRQQARFDQLAAARRAAYMQTVTQHAAQQGDQLYRGEAEAQLDNETKLAIANLAGKDQYDDAVINANVDPLRNMYAEYARYQGLPEGSPLATKQLNSLLNTVHTGVLERQMGEQKDLLAQNYWERVQDGLSKSLDAKAFAVLRERVQGGTVDGDGMRAAAEIWTASGPKTDIDPVNLDAMLAAANALFPDDEKRREATIKHLTRSKAAFDASSTDRQATAAGKLWGMLADPTAKTAPTLAQIQATPEYKSLNGVVQNQIKEHIEDRGYRIDQQAKSAADYLRNDRERKKDQAWQDLSREQQMQEWARQAADRKAYAAYQDLVTDPEFPKMTEQQILAKTPELGRVNTTSALASWAKLQDVKKLPVAKVDQGMLYKVADDFGLSPYATGKTEKQRADLGAFEVYVKQQIAAKEAVTGVELPPEEKRQIMERAAIDVLLVDGYFSDTRKRVFDITVQDIPKADYDRIKTKLTSMNSKSDDKEILDYYIFEKTGKQP